MTLLRWLTFVFWSLTVSLTVLLFLFLFSDASISSTMTLPPLRDSDVVVSVSIDFLWNSKQDTLFHCIVYDYVNRSRKKWRLCLLGFVTWQISYESILQHKIENLRQFPFTWRSIKTERRLKFYPCMNSIKLFYTARYLGQCLWNDWIEWLNGYPNEMSWVLFYLLRINFKYSRFSPLGMLQCSNSN